MHGEFLPAIVRVFGRWGVLIVLGLGGGGEARAGAHPLAECRAQVRQQPRSLKGYICLLAHQGDGRTGALRFLDARMRLDPQNPRPHLYAGILRTLAGEAVDDREWRMAMAGFAREHEPAGEVYAATSLVSARCIGRARCDRETLALLWRARELARTSGRVDLMQVTEIWTMKVSFALDDMDGAEGAERRLLALGPPRSLWLKSETLQARAHLAASLEDHARRRTFYAELLDTLDPDDPRRPAALGGLAAATLHLAMQRLESRDTAERLLRQAIAEQERAGVPLMYAETGYLSSRVQLAMLLGPTPESFSLLGSTLQAQLSRGSWRTPLYPRLSLAELLATADPPRLEEAMQVAEEAVQYEFAHDGDFEQARALVLRSRMRFRRGQFSPGRADGLAALDHAERLREQQRAMPLRLRYAQTLSFAYQSLAGALTRYRPVDDGASLDDAFQVMERLRARGLMETLLAEDRGGEPLPRQSPTLAVVRGQLTPAEALLSFQVWRPEPTMDAPYREGSSWVTVVTSGRVEAFPIPNADLLEPQIRAWTGLLARRDGTDRVSGAKLYRELLAPALAALPPGIERLVVVPDGPLHRLPFDALSAGPGAPYLAERFAVSIAPSASLWVRFRAAPRLAPGRLLVLADPSEGSADRAILRDSTGVFGALVHAHREAEVALSAFPTGSELRTGPPASEAFLKSASLEGISLLHLATHAIADERDPEHAAVVLAPGSSAEDGRLEPQEIGRLPLGGKTVVLAGCETSAGPLFRGEGVMSLARAFFGAGASAVVGTLDRARDDEASVFFSSLYRALGRGASIGEAVAAAKREGIRRGAPPAAWANVVLLGDAEARPRAHERRGMFPMLLTGVVLAFAGFGARRWWRGGPRHPPGSPQGSKPG
ncbi:MAG TPA: CHAT domain-containing protein [Myxococcaceae bacterium]|nr:CHAT domain-containing protein [Myxococcaceae bacterium]